MFQEVDRESGQAVVDLEGDTRFRRGIGVADAGFRKLDAQTVEDRLVGDFAGETDIARRYFSDLGRHQRAAPMRWRARQMRRAAAVEPGEMIGDRLPGAGEDKRSA